MVDRLFFTSVTNTQVSKQNILEYFFGGYAIKNGYLG